MKATKFLFVMAMAAGLAACTKELVEPGKPVDSIEEVKGAKVIASGFSINPNASDLQTKTDIQDGKSVFTDGDVAGVAWFSDGKLNLPQTGVALSKVTTYVSANHKLEWDGRFKSNSNVFEGWHIAYRPYVEMKKPADITGITVNPVLADNLNEDLANQFKLEWLENAPMFSAAYMVTEDDVENGVVSFDMPLGFVVNDLVIDLHVDPTFGDQIKALMVESIELSSHKDRPLFLTSLSVNPKKFPDDASAFTAANFGTDKAFYGEKYAQTSVTVIAEENQANYTLGAGAGEGKFLRTRMFVAPVATPATALKISDLALKVTLSNGSYFTLKAPNDKESDSYKNGFGKLYDLLTDGWNGYSLKGLHNNPIGLKFELTPADFHTNYQVKNVEGGNTNIYEVIGLAKEAGATSISLKFDSGVKVPYNNDLVEALKIDEETYLTINCSSSKTAGATFVISDDQTWNNNIILGSWMNVEVTKDGDLTIAENNNKDQFKVVSLTNAGTVNVGEDVNIAATSFANTGVINVSKESTITVDGVLGGVTGNVVYAVEGTEKVTEINTLINNTNLGTLIVNGVNGDKKWTLDGEANWGADGTYAGLTVQMTGSEISSGNNITVKNLTFEGNNTIECGTLTVADALADKPITTPADYITTINADVEGAVVAYGDLTVGNVSSTLTVADDVVVTAGSVKGASIGAGAEVTVGSVTGAATIGDRAQVEAVAFTKGVTVGEKAVVNVTAAKLTSAAISGGLTVAKNAVVNVFGKLTGASKAPISVAEGATLNVEGAVTATKGMTIGTNATVTINGVVTIKDGSVLNIVEAAGVTVTGEVIGAVTVEGTEVKVDGNVKGAVTVAEGSKLTVIGSITGETVTVGEGATLEANAVVAALTVEKNAKVTVSGIEGNVKATDATSIVVGEDGIKAGKIDVDADEFTVNGDINITSDDDKDDVVVSEGTKFNLHGSIKEFDETPRRVAVVINGEATLKHTNMPSTSKLTVNGNVTIDTEFMDGIRVSLGNVDNNGALTVVGGTPEVNEKYVYVYNLDLEGSTATTVKAGNTLYYYGEVTLGGSTSGTIKKADVPDPLNGYEVIGGKYYVNKPDGLAKALASTADKLEIVLESDVTVNAGDFGTATEININANGKNITFNQVLLGVNAITTNGATLKISNATIKVDGAGATSDYYNHNLVFNCPVEMNNVVTENAIQVDYAGKEICKFNKVTFKDHSTSYQNKGYYALWISPNGQTVELNECSFDMAYGEKGKDGRGIKIYDKTISDDLGLTLKVNNTNFYTDAKAAVEVYTGKPIDITWVGGTDTYAGCKQYNKKPVWLSEDVKTISSDFDIVMQCINKIKVNGVSLTYDDIEKY